MDKSLPKKLHPYSYWGIHFDGSQDEEYIANCPFCNKEGHFFCNENSAAFDCKRCGKQGSWRDFLGFIHKKYLKLTTDEALLAFVKRKGVPLPALKRWEVASYDGLIFWPVYNAVNEVVDLRRYTNKKENRTAGSDSVLLGNKQFLNKKREGEIVYVCEGSLDAFCLDWLLRRLGEPGIVVAVAGSNNFRADWAYLFEFRDVVICYDNDESGYGTINKKGDKATGSLKAAAFISSFANSVSYIVWPTEYKLGYDLRDLINENKKTPKRCFKLFKSFISLHHKFHALFSNDLIGNTGKSKPPVVAVSLQNILDKARTIFKVDEIFERGIKLAFATCISQSLPGDVNPWLFLVGPPGSGKTLILGMCEKSRLTLWESTLSSKALISGYNLGNAPGMDHSILSRIDGKCLVLKDFTEVIHKSEMEMNEVFSILRGAFDGRVRRPYGTGFREYECNFTMLAGVTNIINAFSNTSVGERFLKYDVTNYKLTIEEEEAIQEAAIQSQLLGGEALSELHELVTHFLNKEYDFSGTAVIGYRPQWFADQVKPLANLAAYIRTTVALHERGEKYGHQVYTPIRESGNRLTVQFEKLAIALAMVDGKQQIDEEIYETIKIVAKDTIQGFKLDIVTFLVKHPASTEKEIREGIRTKAVSGYLSELEQLRIIQKEEVETKTGRAISKQYKYSLTKVIIDLWNRAKL